MFNVIFIFLIFYTYFYYIVYLFGNNKNVKQYSFHIDV